MKAPGDTVSTPSQGPAGGFVDHDARIRYFVKGAAVQNFGDYLPELLAQAFFMHPRIDADVFRLIGSVIDSEWIRRDLRRSVGIERGIVAFWGCGMREAQPLEPKARALSRFFGVRGPRTREGLGLPPDTVLGDPGLLAPLMHRPASGTDHEGLAICIPHIHDSKSDAELLAISGADRVLRPEIEASEGALRQIMDRIAGAGFVLTASLHGAIIACAYRRPFAFWDNGHVDIVFKWQDFAESVAMPCEFVRDVASGRALYAQVLAPRIERPPLTPILDICPFAVRPSALVRALMFDGRVAADAAPAVIATALDALPSTRLEQIRLLQQASAARRIDRGQAAVALLAAGGETVEHVKAWLRGVRGIG